MGWIENKFEKNFLVTTVDYVFNWARKSAIWPMTFGLACTNLHQHKDVQLAKACRHHD